MRVHDARTGLPRRFVHRAAAYLGPDDLLALAVPLVERARTRGVPVALMVPADTEALVRDAVGSEGLVRLPELDPAVRVSGQTVAARRARELRALTDRSGPVTVLSQHDPESGLDVPAWVEADTAMNIAFASMPLTMTCFYRDLLDPVLATAARHNHPRLVEPDGTVVDNPDHRDPADVLAAYPVPAPPPLGPADRELTFTPWQLTELRAAVVEAARRGGLDAEHAEDFVLAVNEAAGNAVEHGYGTGLLQLWSTPSMLICEVHDSGQLRDPLPGLAPPHPAEVRGRGLWIARQLCDLLHVWVDEDGTHVRLQVELG
jgi:anti-sigma regulatory factor (Ser/Thr protein kinase)